jgi:glycine cleavage system H protein
MSDPQLDHTELNIMAALIRYTKDHEWVRVEGDVATVGITTYAAEQLGDVVFVELPAVGRKVAKGEGAAVVESVKAASDVYSPVTGEVTETNGDLEESPQTVNGAAETAGWFMKLKLADRAELDGLLDEEGYRDYIDTL